MEHVKKSLKFTSKDQQSNSVTVDFVFVNITKTCTKTKAAINIFSKRFA